MNKAELNRVIQQQEFSRAMMRAEIVQVRQHLALAHRRLAQRRWPWYRRIMVAIFHPSRRLD